MADRTTSFAKSVEGLHHEESALDKAPVLRNEFAIAKEQDNQKPQAEKPHGETEKSGSQMIREDAPPLKPTPSGPMRQAQDRVSSAGKVKREAMTEQQKIDHARKLLEIYRAQNPTHGRSHDHDRER
jgi:hypothetical protein